MWVLGIELRFSGLMAMAFIHWALSLTLTATVSKSGWYSSSRYSLPACLPLPALSFTLCVPSGKPLSTLCLSLAACRTRLALPVLWACVRSKRVSPRQVFTPVPAPNRDNLRVIQATHCYLQPSTLTSGPMDSTGMCNDLTEQNPITVSARVVLQPHFMGEGTEGQHWVSAPCPV